MADLSGYFVTGRDSSASYCAIICKYSFSSSSAQCQKIISINNSFEFLKISDSQLFVLGVASASPYPLHMYKITFNSSSVNWANQIAWTSGTWSTSLSESVLSSDGSTIYSFFTFGASSTSNLYFCGQTLSDGNVIATRYKSSTVVSDIWGSALNGDYVVATTFSPASLVMYSISSSTFIIKFFSSDALYGWGVEPSSSR